jgi:DNA-binding NarL/FixJ family response regulator
LVNDSSATTRVLIVDDHVMFSELIARVLDQHDDIAVTGIATTGIEALGALDAQRPDVVVLDYALPGDDGVAVARQLRSHDPDVGIVMLTGLANDEVLRAAVIAGCAGFVTKDKAVDDLVDAVRSVYDGRSAIDPEATARLATPPKSRVRGDRFDLTARELEVLGLLAEGLSTREIAETLFISNNTARNHVQRLIAKLGAHSRLGAVANARRAGLVSTAAGS